MIHGRAMVGRWLGIGAMLAILAPGCPGRRVTSPAVVGADPVTTLSPPEPVTLRRVDGSTETRLVLRGDLLLLGVREDIPYRYRGEKQVRCQMDGRLIRVNGRLIGLDISDLSPDRAAALLRRHPVETVVWRGAESLPGPVIRALGALPTRSLVLALRAGPKEQEPSDPARLAPLSARLYGLVWGLESRRGLAAFRALAALRVLRLEVPIGGREIGDISRLSALQVLRLPSVLPAWRLGRAGLGPIGRLSKLRSLQLSVDQLEDSALLPLAGLRRLQHLDLGFNRIKGSGLRHLRGLRQLALLDLSGNPLPGEALEPLGHLSRLKMLNLKRTRVDDAGLAHLQGLSGLAVLDLSETLVGDDGLARLKGLPGLAELRLFQTAVGDGGLKHLHGLQKLRQLDLRDTRVSRRGLAALARALPGCRLLPKVLHRRAPQRLGFAPGPTGIPACDEYIRIYRCYLANLPAAARSVATASLKKTIQSWIMAISAARRSGPARQAMAKGCQTAVEALKKAWRNNPLGRGCVP